VVIELAVVGDPAGAVLVGHRLGAGWGEMENCKSPVTEAEIVLDIEALAVRTAVSDGMSHPSEEIPVDRSIRFRIMKNSYDAAHWT